MTKICSPYSFTFCLKNVHTFVCVFKDWIITKTLKRFWKQKQKDFKLIRTITVQHNGRGWRATRWRIVQYGISIISTSEFKRLYLLSILSQWRSSFPFWLGAYYHAVKLFLYLCLELCLNMKTALSLIKLSSITTATSTGPFKPKNRATKYLLCPWTDSLEEENISSSNSLPSESWP